MAVEDSRQILGAVEMLKNRSLNTDTTLVHVEPPPIPIPSAAKVNQKLPTQACFDSECDDGRFDGDSITKLTITYTTISQIRVWP